MSEARLSTLGTDPDGDVTVGECATAAAVLEPVVGEVAKPAAALVLERSEAKNCPVAKPPALLALRSALLALLVVLAL